MMGCRLLALHGDLHPASTIKIQRLSPQTHTKLPSPSAHRAKKKKTFRCKLFFLLRHEIAAV